VQEGSILKVIRFTQLQACPKKIIKNSFKTFWTDHVYIIGTQIRVPEQQPCSSFYLFFWVMCV
jgi:hypothetical protein